VHAFLDLPAATTDAAILGRVGEKEGRLDRVDRDLFRARFGDVGSGSHRLTIVSVEPSGTRGIQRETVVVP
jgi:hypothetical protein